MTADPIVTVDFAEVERWRHDGIPHAFIDVRERGEYALGQIPGACPLPRGLLEVLLERFVPWKDLPVVLYSNGEHRSGLAAATCAALGYQDVRVLRGGITGWAEAGNAPTYGVNVLGKTFGEALSVTDQVVQVDPDLLAEMIDEQGAVVVDARTRSEYDKGHIPGAVHMPGGELVPAALRAGLDSADREAPVVVHCAGRTRSILGAYLLGQAGLTDVYALRNGTMAWVMSGRGLEQAGRDRLPGVAEHEGADERAAGFAASFVDGTEAGSVTVDDLRRMIAEERVYVIDVRLESEHEGGHVPGALSCPGGQLANAVDEFLPVRDAHLVCYSNAETRSRVGAGLLSRIGYRNVRWLAGGLQAWAQAGGETAAGGTKDYLDDLDFLRPGTQVLTPEQVAVGVEAGELAVIDVRRSSEYALCHVAGSTWVPRGDLERRIEAVLTAERTPVLVSDRMLRSALSADTMRALGHECSVLEGGLTAWIAQGRAVTQGLDGADVSLREAKEDAELVARRPQLLERNREDMERYLDWEERLGHALLEADHDGELTDASAS